MTFDLLQTDDTFNLNWFGVKLARVTKPVTVVLAQAFRRDIKDDGVYQGAGLLQIGKRHLFYVGSSRGRTHVCLGFFWLTRSKP